MKRYSPAYLLVLLSTGSVLAIAAGCQKNTDADPNQVKLAIRYLQSGGTNTFMYADFKRVDASPHYLTHVGGSSDSPGGSSITSPEFEYPAGQYRFRVWCPQIILTQPGNGTAPHGQLHAELLVNGQVKSTLDLDAAHPSFENDTCSQSVVLQLP
jgi:hypothetical protein